jgi:seryl-tRNA synthetase
LAQVQKLVASKSIEQTLAFIGQAAGVVPEVLDKIKIDEAVDEFADAHGTSRRILNTAEEVNKIRTARQKQQQAKEKEAKEMAMAETLAKTSPALANADKTRAETGQIMTDSLVSQQELGAII